MLNEMDTKLVPYSSSPSKRFQQAIVARSTKPLRPWVRWKDANDIDKHFIQLATRCWSSFASTRPSMKEVGQKLEIFLSYLSGGDRVGELEDVTYGTSPALDKSAEKSPEEPLNFEKALHSKTYISKDDQLQLLELYESTKEREIKKLRKEKDDEIEALRKAKDGEIEKLRAKIARLESK